MCTISVMLCTHNSRAIVAIAIESYLRQSYDDRELVVIDDGEPVEDLVRDIPGVQYHYLPANNLAEKRNHGVRLAKGEHIAHFDSDDWSGRRRLADQAGYLRRRKAKVVGYSKAFWYDVRSNQASYAACGLWGASLMYEREWALEHPWNETVESCEDGHFLKAAIESGVARESEGGENFVALAHNGNAERPFGFPGWPIVANSELPEGFREYVRL